MSTWPPNTSGGQTKKPIGKHPDRAFWERLNYETTKAYAAFKIYRELPGSKRSYKAVADELGHNHSSTVQQWSKKYMWTARIEAMESEHDRIRFLEEREDRQRYRKRTFTMLTLMENRVIEYLQNMDWTDMSAAQVGQWTEIINKIRRLDANQATENVDHHITGANRNTNDLTEKIFGNPELAAVAVRLMEQPGPGENEPSSPS